jgi:hypothetical protein
VSLARAQIGKPGVLILDEATALVDAGGAYAGLYKGLARQRPDMSEASATRDLRSGMPRADTRADEPLHLTLIDQPSWSSVASGPSGPACVVSSRADGMSPRDDDPRDP